MINKTRVFKRLALPFCLCVCLFPRVIFADVYVISDIDDTIKTSNSVGRWYESARNFFKKIPYYQTRNIFVAIDRNAKENNEQSHFYYVTAAPRLVFNPERFLRKHFFPMGPVTMKKLLGGESTYTYKYRTIKAIIENSNINSMDRVYFFGDNSSQDARVYHDLVREFGLKNSSIFIRDVKTNATRFSNEFDLEKLENVDYFLSEAELIGHPALNFLDKDLKKEVIEKHQKNSLIPSYTLKTYFRRASYIIKCKIFHTGSKKCDKEKLEKARTYWQNYHSEVQEILRNRESLPIEE